MQEKMGQPICVPLFLGWSGAQGSHLVGGPLVLRPKGVPTTPRNPTVRFGSVSVGSGSNRSQRVATAKNPQ